MLATRVDNRRVFVFGVAGLIPAALVTLLLVHQPSIGERRLYPTLRQPLTVVGFGLALATLIAWALAPSRFNRSSLSGLAWAGVTVLLCIGPFVESAPRARLFALELSNGEVAWATSRAASAPVLENGVLVVTEVDAASLVGLDPDNGDQLWRRAIGEANVPTAPDALPPGVILDDGRVGSTAGAEGPWSLALSPGERALAVAASDDGAYAYVSTSTATGPAGGTIVKFDPDNGTIHWRVGLPESVAVTSGTPDLDATATAVVVAGGERIGALDAEDGDLLWSQSVASLGKSRGYALPGVVQDVVVTDSYVFLSVTPDR
jgi:outer membrane protein assembly factor BamB